MLKRKLLTEQSAEDIYDSGNSVDESVSTSSDDSCIEHQMHKDTKPKILILSSRGINARQRHLLKDLTAGIPHSKKGKATVVLLDNKYDSKNDLFALNELAELNSCSHCVFFEARKPNELFMWFSKCPGGPSLKFHVQNIHSVDELNSTGNFTFGTRPLLSFDPGFSRTAHGKMMQSMIADIFGTPAGHKRGDRHDFFDHVFHFADLDGRLWFRSYQITDAVASTLEGLSLKEIGPRFVLQPVVMLEGSFRGRVIWSNSDFKSPASHRLLKRLQSSSKFAHRKTSQAQTKQRKLDAFLSDDEFEKGFKN